MLYDMLAHSGEREQEPQTASTVFRVCSAQLKSSRSATGQAGRLHGKAAGKHTASSKGQVSSGADEIRATSRGGDTQSPLATKPKSNGPNIGFAFRANSLGRL